MVAPFPRAVSTSDCVISVHGSGNPEIAWLTEEDEEPVAVVVAPGAGLELEHPVHKHNDNAAQQSKENSRANHLMLCDLLAFIS